MSLLCENNRINPSYVILDTAINPSKDSIIELKSENTDLEANAIGKVEML